MSMIKLKNAVVKAARAALAAHYGRPIDVNGKLEGSRLSLHIGAIGEPMYLPKCYRFDDWGCSFAFMLGQEIRTPAAIDAAARVKAAAEQAIVAAGGRGSVYVGIENGADDAHKAALRAEWERTGLQPGTAPAAILEPAHAEG
jgi:hypothetical protein